MVESHKFPQTALLVDTLYLYQPRLGEELSSLQTEDSSI